MTKTVGIVGAGVSGLVAIKICLEEGLQPTAFEKSSKIGGLWNYDEDTSSSSSGRVYKSLVVNVCKVNMAYSDFPMSASTPPFPNHEQYVQYLHDYVDYFKLRKHIQMRTEVIKIEKAGDYDDTGRWTIHFCLGGKETARQTFDFIMICSGYFTTPIIPPYPSLDEFTGRVLHSAQYRRRVHFEDKKVVVIDDLDTRDLYKYVFPVRLLHATLACIGLVSTDNNASMVSELQCRWSVQVFKGTISLPPYIKMKQDITRKLQEQKLIFGKVKHLVRGSALCDELANDIGCYPSIKRFLLTDPRLAFKLMFGPLTPSSYRLIGPRRCRGARKAVMNSWEDSLTGLSGKSVKKNDSFFRWLILLPVFLIIFKIIVY